MMKIVVGSVQPSTSAVVREEYLDRKSRCTQQCMPMCAIYSVAGDNRFWNISSDPPLFCTDERILYHFTL